MATLKELLDQKASLERQIIEARNTSRTAVVSEIKALMEANGLSLADLGAALSAPAKKATGAKGKVAAKYRHPDTGESWTGRGLKPRWLSQALDSGKSLSDFAL